MREYVISVVAASILCALSSFVSYGRGNERAVRAAIAMILIYTVCMPVLRFTSEFDIDDVDFEAYEEAEIDSGYYLGSVEEAFSTGVKGLLSEKLSINKDDIRVSIVGFDLRTMRAQRIRVTFVGRAALADTRRAEQIVEDAGLGECEVNIEING